MNPGTLAACLLIWAWTVPAPAVERIYNPDDLKAGRALYRDACAECHGVDAEGQTPDWQQRDADGNYPAPPLNGTAHTWHHPATVLFRTIKEGTRELGGNMPAWGGKLSDNEIILIINWLTSLWPDEIYQAWRRQN